MKGGKPGQYVSGDSIIHQLDPRTKIIACFLIILTMVINDRFAVLSACLGIIMAATALAGIGPATVWHSIRRLWPLFLLTLIFQAWGARGEAGGLYTGVEMVLRILVLLLAFSLLTATTTPARLTAGLEWLCSPLSRFKVPVRQFSMLIGTALRFIPDLLGEAENLKRAQQSRGAQFSSASLTVRIRCVMAVLIPLLANSIQRADNLAAAMESRCYGGKVEVSRAHDLRFARRDYIGACLMTAIAAMAILIR